MNTDDLKRLLPRDKNDVGAAQALVSLGYPKVAPVLPKMLDWLKTYESPVEAVMRDFFILLGHDAVPVVQKSLSSRNDLLKYAIVNHVVVRWPAGAIEQLKVPLQALAATSSPYGTDITALRLLAEHQLVDRNWLLEWATFKRRRLSELFSQAESIERLLKR